MVNLFTTHPSWDTREIFDHSAIPKRHLQKTVYLDH